MSLKPNLFNSPEQFTAPPQSEPANAHALRLEGADAAASRATTYSIAAGDTFNGTLTTSGDADWVRVTLQPGTYVVTLDGRGTADPLSDPFLRVMDAGGAQIAYDDDGGQGYNSRVVLNVTAPGTYYLEAGSYSGSYSGAYSLEIEKQAGSGMLSMDEIAKQLTDGFWETQGGARRAFDVEQGGTLNVDLSGLTNGGLALAKMALAAWESVLGITFDSDPEAGDPIHITFDDNASGAYSTSEVFGNQISSSFVNVGRDWLTTYGSGYNTYSYQTYIHEIGHALGLGHAGNYNGSATYGIDNSYLNDSWQASVMSYFSQTDNTAVNASLAFVASAMMADILAMQDLYGATTIRTGNNTYGELTNAGPSYEVIATLLRDSSRRDDITFTIFDQGGVDRLDMRMDSNDQRINLTPGAISSAYGLIGNISIVEGTMIEELLTGSGNDYVLSNSASNMIRGGAGSDTIYGFSGNDTLFGDQGADRLIGGAGNDVYFLDQSDIVSEAVDGGIDTVYSIMGYRLGAELENLNLSRGVARSGVGNQLDNNVIGNNAINVLQGLGGADTLFGSGGNDTLFGGNGDDWLNGGNGRDLLSGGAGNDIYSTDGQDVISEAAGGGTDTVRATTTLALAANVENLVMVGTGVQHGFGNALSNVLRGNAAANFLSGNDGSDTLTGGGGSDNFVFRSGGDIITDFADDVDTIRIDDAAWGGGARSVAQLLADATVVGGSIVFDFGNGNLLTVNGLTNVAALQNDLIVI
ncbi:M10 family metallopeptidase [Paracoccus lutimaris]|uniref:Serralysin n=1 Tax=Paracoccus lutimaris TaxID=1490030 RepID=A0A368YY07_9RHOB|nr:M10 family metallopeptidase C-terminal domain-containing protein [Paracoccus lutimaris]RCW85090.1 serralysin [Paracoccus lutimaris]